MSDEPKQLEITFLGSGNAFAFEGRAFSSFLVNRRYLFDCGPTVLQQLSKLEVSPNDIEVVFISHFHADHFFGLPFLMLAGKYGHRTKELVIVGPPGIEQRTEGLLRLGYPGVMKETTTNFSRRYVEVRDGCEACIGEVSLTAARVQHVDEFECFAFRAGIDGHTVVYSGDTTLCSGLLSLIPGAEVIVVECSCNEVPVHLSPAGVEEVRNYASPEAHIFLTHLDSHDHPSSDPRLTVAHDLATYRI